MDSTGFTDKTGAEVLVGKHPSKRKPHISTLEAYKETPVFITVGIVEYVFKLVTWKLSGSVGPGGTDLEALQWCLLKFGDHSKKLRTSVEYFLDWLSNQSPSQAANQNFMSGRLIALDKLSGVRPLVVGGNWRRLVAKCMLKVTVPEATHACKDDHICVRLKAVIYGAVHGVKYILDAKSSK